MAGCAACSEAKQVDYVLEDLGKTIKVCPRCGFSSEIDGFPSIEEGVGLWHREIRRRGYARYCENEKMRKAIDYCHQKGLRWVEIAAEEKLLRPTLLSRYEYDRVTDWVNETLDFQGTIDLDVEPFVIPWPHDVYSLPSEFNETQFEERVNEAIRNCVQTREQVIALDFHSQCYLYFPHNPPTEYVAYSTPDEFYDWTIDFPFYYPGGDYYFFFAQDFRFGYLGHPWRKEVWVFGDELLQEIEKAAAGLGWEKVREVR